MAERKIDTVIFDMGGVLTELRSNDYFDNMGFSDETVLRLKKAIYRNWDELDRGVLTVDEVIERFVAADPGIENEIRSVCRNRCGILRKRDAAIPWIESVKARGRKAYVLSNCSSMVMRDNPEAFDFAPHADGCYWSFEHKVIKPDKAIYLDMMYLYKVEPTHAVFIDDTQRNLDSAAELGLHTILYRTQEQAERELNELLTD